MIHYRKESPVDHCRSYGYGWEENDEECYGCKIEHKCRDLTLSGTSIVKKRSTLAYYDDDEDEEDEEEEVKAISPKRDTRNAIMHQTCGGKINILARRIAIKSIPQILRVAAKEIESFSEELAWRKHNK
jgi:hypothetical protein